ncbi:MAG: GHKL domain-containing protein [Lachnospiraceae bacterium]|nr:GHKL domain-containing protein [Lachnospiraceae bacterium]
MSYLIYGVQLLTYVLAGVLFYFWGKSLIGTQEKGKMRLGASIIVASALLYAISFIPNKIVFLLLSILLLVLLGLDLFEKDKKTILYYTLTYWVIGLSIYGIVEFLVEVPFATALTILIQGILCIPIMKGFGSAEKAYVTDSYPAMIVIPTLFSILQVCVSSLEVVKSELWLGNILFVGGNGIIIVVSVMVLYFIREFSKVVLEKEELKLRMERDAIEKKHYQNMEEQHDAYDVLVHDMKHVIRTMAALSQSENSEEIQKLVERFDISIGKVTDKEYCGNKILNALLLEKIGFAEEKGIKLDLNIIEPLKLDMIEDLDLITMMGNLLDNAIIAESKVSEPKEVFCRVALSKDFEHVVIQVENSHEGKMFKAKARPEGKLGAKHGIGLNSIEEIVKKYGGIMDGAVENGRYWTKIIIPT